MSSFFSLDDDDDNPSFVSTMISRAELDKMINEQAPKINHSEVLLKKLKLRKIAGCIEIGIEF